MELKQRYTAMEEEMEKLLIVPYGIETVQMERMENQR